MKDSKIRLQDVPWGDMLYFTPAGPVFTKSAIRKNTRIGVFSECNKCTFHSPNLLVYHIPQP